MDRKIFDLEQTLLSGQCFRATKTDGKWLIISGVDEFAKTLSINQEEIDQLKSDDYWYNYFDLNTDYETMKEFFSSVSPIMKTACDYAPGIRILNQDPWEALCSFVVSQNNNIKRISGIVERMSLKFGKENKEGIHGFPSSYTLARATETELRETGLGFRAPYIQNTARAVEEGLINFENLKKIDIEEARKILMTVKGIGPKVADCALLFGCHRLDCFPLDVWMKRVMSEYFPGKDKSIFGDNAGVAQQYLFHWARTGGIK